MLQVLETFSLAGGLLLMSNSAGCVSNIALLSTELTSLKSILMKSTNWKLSFLVLGFSTVVRIPKCCPKNLRPFLILNKRVCFETSTHFFFMCMREILGQISKQPIEIREVTNGCVIQNSTWIFCLHGTNESLSQNKLFCEM